MKKQKMIPCKQCGQEISAGAKVCPHCGEKNKKPVYKKWWFWLILVVIIAIAASGGSDKGKQTEEAAAAKSETPVSVVATDAETSVAGESEAVEPEKSAVVSDTTEEENVPTEYKSAVKKAESYGNVMNMSKKAIYDQLTSEYGEKFDKDAADYAMEHVDIDWKANALAKAENYSDTMYMSKEGIYDQLVSEYGEQFTEEEAQYAVDNLQADYKENALQKAKSYQDMDMSSSAIYDQLISDYGEKFTKDEAQYAVEHLE